jgi:hypothetical protein
MAKKITDRELTNNVPLRTAVLRSLETSVGEVAGQFGIAPNELLDAQRLFLEAKMEVHQPKPVQEEPKQPGRLEQFYHSMYFEWGMKLTLSPLLAWVCWKLPRVLEKRVDPLTNTIIWVGFTDLMFMAFLSLGIEVVFFAMHNVNFRFFYRFAEKGKWDYESFIMSDKLTYYEKCQLNQQKYLVYLGLSVYLASDLIRSVLSQG